MNTRRDRFRRVLRIGVCCSGISLQAVEIPNNAQAVNIAGKQRMFTQRMLKDYAMIGMGNTFADPKKDLQKTTQAFSEHLDALEQYISDSEIKKSIGRIKQMWQPIKRELGHKPELQKALEVKEGLEKLLKASDVLTHQIADTDTEYAKDENVINLAGRQRMLSQRMAALYMLKVWGVHDPAFHQELNDTITLFGDSHAKIEKAPLKDKKTLSLLKKVKRSFIFFEMMNRSKSKFIPTLIYKKSNDILDNMNRVTERYVQKESH